MKRQLIERGFTLIELLIVIMLLGILAFSVIGKFIGIASDANIAILKSMGGVMQSAGQSVYTKSVLQGVNELAKAEVDINATDKIETLYGYPSASRHEGISKAISNDIHEDWIWSTDYRETVFYLTIASFTHTSGAYVNQVPIVATNCYLTYRPASVTARKPTVEYVITGC